jgi:hypothetical protein
MTNNNSALDEQCGIFTPCKNCNIEARSHNYATVDEAVLSPRRAEICRAVTSRASPHLLPGNSYKHFDHARVGKGHVTASAVTSRVSDQGFIRETEARLQGVFGSRQPRKVRSWRRSDRVNWILRVSSFQFRSRWVNWSKVKWVKVTELVKSE